MEIKLQKPIEKDGHKIDKITLELDNLTGDDIIEAEKEARMRGDQNPNPLFSSQGLAVIAARASGMIADDIAKLAAPDFLMLTQVVSNFLYGWVLPTLIQSVNSENES